MSIELSFLHDFLVMRRAPEPVRQWASETLSGLSIDEVWRPLSTIPKHFEWPECELLLAAFLHAITDGVLDRRGVVAFFRTTDAMSMEPAWRNDFVVRELGVDEDALACLGILGLPLGVDEEQVKRAHRRQVKLHHPDRLQHMAEEFVRLAIKRTDEIHGARDRLLAALSQAAVFEDMQSVERITELADGDSPDTLLPD